MTTALVVTEERLSANRYPYSHLEHAERQAAGILEAHLQRLVERACALTGASRASLAVLDPASQVPVIVAAWAQSSSGPRPATLRVHEELARWVTMQRVPAFIADGVRDPHARALGLMAVGSLLAVPLLVGQQVLGALTISSPAISAFSHTHLRLLELGADLGALAIFQARQLDALAKQTLPPTRSLDLSRGLEPTPDAPAILELAVSAIQRLVPCEEAVVYRYEAASEILCGLVGWGPHSRRLADVRIPVRDPHSVTAWVAQQRRPLLQASGANGFVGRATGELLAHRELALLAVPVVAREQLWGVITLARAVPFEPGDLRTMLTLSQLIAPGLIQTRDIRQGWRG